MNTSTLPIPVVCMLFVILLFSSCRQSRNALSEPLQPLPVEKGDLRISGSVGGFSDANLAANLQAAYKVADKYSAGLNLYGIGPKTRNRRGDDYAKSYMAEAFIGTNWFKRLSTFQEGTGEKVLSPHNGLLFDVNLGYGINGISSQAGEENVFVFPSSGGGENLNGNINFHTRYAFLQTGLTVQSKWVNVGMSLRGVGMKYIHGEVNGQQFTRRQDMFVAQAEEEGIFTYLVTAFRFSVGGSKVKVFTTVSVVSNVFDEKTMAHLPRPLMIGVEFNIGAKGREED